MWYFVGVKFGDSLQETIVSIRQKFEKRKPFFNCYRWKTVKTVKKQRRISVRNQFKGLPI